MVAEVGLNCHNVFALIRCGSEPIAAGSQFGKLTHFDTHLDKKSGKFGLPEKSRNEEIFKK